ncbi:PepSY domain-containing protein [Metabacillus sediminilitoris]|uniref:PepSY domain-containing protein n=1 Tax=Metabacillus sediminilitoris TaxID=2567941 RepID=A0A4S4C1C2_9BACI|nr:PepSY domain-containing protein [Metabacillus sediminilitoris]QGQ48188.1 hypothetical protein GMB29_24755 [Metabacillus sediminilitoris]THF81451.1 hypothetical protein E6W99_05955 [Metabacillus sediminilitoris]
MKKMVTITLAAAMVLGGSVAINHSFAKEDNQTKAEQTTKQIGIEEAKAAALEKVNGTVESVELEDGQSYYEVDIIKDQKEFDIKVDAASAEILKVEENRNDDDDDDRELEAAAKGAVISEDEAVAIAKKNITGEIVKIELDEDDGRFEYEMELNTSNGEAEITIDATSGKVLELEQDDDDNDDD